jgi:hypothetical protein
MALGPLAPVARQRVFSGLGVVLPGALLNTYAAGTTTPQNTFSDQALTSANTNPIVADSGGLFGPIYVTPGIAYKFVLTTSASVAVWSQDYVQDDSVLITTVAGGGTGASTFTAHGVLIGEGTSPIAATTTGTAGQVLTSNGASADPTFQAATGDFSVCRGRLTLESGVPVSVTDQTAKTNIFFTPYLGNTIGLYDGSTAWTVLTFTEKTLALGTLTNDLPYDVFAYNNSGVVALEALAWTNKTTRATALVQQDGVLSKTGALTRRYLGTFHTTATTTTEDSAAKRLLQNYYHRVMRPVRVIYDTAYTYTTATYRQANAVATNQIEVVNGVAESAIDVWIHTAVYSSTIANVAMVHVGEDSTTTPATESLSPQFQIQSVSQANTISAHLTKMPAVGWHRYVWLEFGATGGNWNPASAGTGTPHNGMSGTWTC